MPPRRKAEPVKHPFDQQHGSFFFFVMACTEIYTGTGFAPEDLTAYYAVAPSILHSVIDLWLRECSPPAPIEQTVFLDIGAGKGRAMLLASQYPFLRVEGIELNPALAATTQSNIAIWRTDPHAEALAPLLLHQADATRHPLPPEPTLAYLFHPFEAKLLRRFLRHVSGSVEREARSLDLVYVNAEHDSLLDRLPGFERLWMGRVPMSTADHLADLDAIATQKEYGSTGDEVCAFYRTVVK